MLRNYPSKTVIGFIIWFILAITLCAVIGHPIMRILSYTSLIFFAIIQGWSVRETYLQECGSRYTSDISLRQFPEKAKRIKIAAYILMTFAPAAGCWAVSYDSFSAPLAISVLISCGLFICFRLDKMKELQTAREIATGTSFIVLVFIMLLPLSFDANHIAALISSFAVFVAALGNNSIPQKMVRLTLNDFRFMHRKSKCVPGASPEETFEWYEIYPYIMVACKRKKALSGFVSLIPVKKEFADLLSAGIIRQITLKDIANIQLVSSDKPVSLVLSCLDYDGSNDMKDALMSDALIQYEDIFDYIQTVYILDDDKLTATDFQTFKK